jgi:hypothetical protein
VDPFNRKLGSAKATGVGIIDNAAARLAEPSPIEFCSSEITIVLKP